MQTAGPPAGGSPLAGETKRMAVPTVRLAMQIVCKIVSSACRQRCVNRRSPGGQVSERKNEWVNGCIQDLVHTESHPAELSDQDDHLCPMLTSTGIRGRLPNSYDDHLQSHRRDRMTLGSWQWSLATAATCRRWVMCVLSQLSNTLSAAHTHLGKAISGSTQNTATTPRATGHPSLIRAHPHLMPHPVGLSSSQARLGAQTVAADLTYTTNSKSLGDQQPTASDSATSAKAGPKRDSAEPGSCMRMPYCHSFSAATISK
eukprot:CAMPEP_0174336762 /NCGR_PEP_ID=MMETSP0810-20121108/21786_1 /TAXON_ID=73025 ORGANISM="Eutreptiella gymnastica-like, Strain CCMP1594" /NCGR_SAMPLE_ID=MMETSP0810 /ASSEMBLY_ACC=CAM_ASM_000659 /LENGTH=258 /DNA_ID=CAMNT_0015455823 /DNA_START=46 /DNA_END=823 /DNA_ORIENTATION=-